MKKGMLLALMVLFGGIVMAQKKEAVIKTSAECGSCKERIEEKLNYVKGVVFADLNVESKELTVKYKEAKITLDEIRQIVSELGYDADGVKANEKAQKELPKCCQPGGMKSMEHGGH